MANPTYRGVEIPVITVPPHYKDPVKFTLSELTAIAEALDVSEDRQQCYPRSLYGISYGVLTRSARETGFLQRQFESLMGKPVGCPIWHQKLFLTANVAISDTTITCENIQNSALTHLKYAVITDGVESFEVVRVASYDDAMTTLTLSVGAAKAWTANQHPVNGPFIIPLCYGYLKRPAPSNEQDEIARLQIDFEERSMQTGVYSYADGSGTGTDPNDVQFVETREVPSPPTITIVTDGCRAQITLTWDTLEAVDYYTLHTDDGDTGVTDRTILTITCADIGSDPTASVTFENAFLPDSKLWLVAHFGNLTSKTSNLVDAGNPEVAMPLIASMTHTSDGGAFPTTLQSRTEQPFIIITPVRDFIQDRLVHTQGSGSTTPTWTEAPGSTLKFTTDGTDPTPSTVNPTGDAEALDWAGVIKARSYVGSCPSPMLIVLVDKVADEHSNFTTVVQNGAISFSCNDWHYIIINDGMGGPQLTQTETFPGCDLVGGGNYGPDAGVNAEATALAAAGGAIPTTSGSGVIVLETATSKAATVHPGAPDPGTNMIGDEWGNGHTDWNATAVIPGAVLFSGSIDYRAVPALNGYLTVENNPATLTSAGVLTGFLGPAGNDLAIINRMIALGLEGGFGDPGWQLSLAQVLMTALSTA